MSANDIPSVGDILGKLKTTSSLGKQLEQAQIWEHWERIAGAFLAEHGRPCHIRKGVLTVEADSPVWMHRFAYRKWAIIGRINRMAGHELVSGLFVRLKDDAPRGSSQDGA